MTTTATGRQAETAAANYLEYYGFEVLDRNFRTRQCEIDIVARKDDIVYCVEVKYRAHSTQGTGLEYITYQKLRQMRFAAEVWSAQHYWNGDVYLSAIELSGPNFTVDEFIESID